MTNSNATPSVSASSKHTVRLYIVKQDVLLSVLKHKGGKQVENRYNHNNKHPCLTQLPTQ